MNASDLIKILPKTSCEQGAVHIWHLDEVYLKIDSRTVYLWRAVDAEGEVLVCWSSRSATSTPR